MIPPKKERGRTRERAPSRLSRALSESPERLRDDDSSEVSKECSPSSARKRSRSRSRERDVDDRGYDTDEAVEFLKKTPVREKPKADSPSGEKYRWGRYASRPSGRKQSFAEWRKSSFEPAKKGGRPGRGGGPPQKGRRQQLARDEGYENIESVALGDRYPDMRKQIGDGTYEYVEVGKMNLDGIPCAREAVKLKEEIPHLDEGEKLTFVGSDGRRVTYKSGESADMVDNRAAESMTAEERTKAEKAIVKEMGLD
jgi:hypothetical protein